MADEIKTVRAEHLSRFNKFDKGHVREIPEPDFKKWKAEGLVKETKKPLGAAPEDPESSPENKPDKK